MAHNGTRRQHRSGLEPHLGGDAQPLPELSGYEPLLGGIRRVGVDVQRIATLLNAPHPRDRAKIIEHAQRFGQAQHYATELAQVIPAHARQRHGDWQGRVTTAQRERAIEAVAVIGSYESVVPVVEALGDSTYVVREAAAKALRAIVERLDPEDPRTAIVYQALVDALAALPLSGRKAVGAVLANTAPDLVLGPLLGRGLVSESWGSRRESAWILGTLGDKRATIRLMDALNDPSHAVRASAAWALGRLDAPIAVQALAEASQEADEIVRAAAIEALGAHAAREADRFEDVDDILEPVVVALHDADRSVRYAALDALMKVNAVEARRALEEYYRIRNTGRY